MAIRLDEIMVTEGRAIYRAALGEGPMVYTAPFDPGALERELSSGLLGGLHVVTVEAVVDVDIPLQIAIRVPVAAWAAVIAELDAVAAMLPDTVLGAHIQIEDDAPKSLPPRPRYDGLIGSAIQWQPDAVPQTTLDVRVADDPWERDGVVLGLSEGLHPRSVATIQAALGSAMQRRVRVISIAEGIDQELW